MTAYQDLMTALATRPSAELSTGHPDLSIRAPKACWSQNSDGAYTWYPQPAGATRVYDPFPSDEMVRRLGAFHEAGHAVVALATGLGVDAIHMSAKSTQFMFHTVVSGNITRWNDFAAYLAAGERAADRWLREAGLWTPERAWAVERGATSDRARAAEFAAETGQAFALLDHPWDGWTQVCSWADGTLSRYWDRVQNLADALMDGVSLDAAAVARIAGLANPSA